MCAQISLLFCFLKLKFKLNISFYFDNLVSSLIIIPNKKNLCRIKMLLNFYLLVIFLNACSQQVIAEGVIAVVLLENFKI